MRFLPSHQRSVQYLWLLTPLPARVLAWFGVNQNGRPAKWRRFFARSAFSLVEVTLALGVAAFCLLSVFGLLPIGLNSNHAAAGQTAANGILSAVMADLRATPAGSSSGAATSQHFSINIPAANQTGTTTLYFSSDGQCVAPSESRSRYLLTISFLANGSSSKSATLANLKVSWPAKAKTPFGSAQTFVAIDRN